MKEKKRMKMIGGEKWYLFSDTVYTYEQAKEKANCWAIRCGSNIRVKIIPHDDGYLLYYR